MIMFDQALFCEAIELKWSVPDYKRVILRFGVLQSSMRFQSTIGDYVAENGLRATWVESGIIGPLKVDIILSDWIWFKFNV